MMTMTIRASRRHHQEENDRRCRLPAILDRWYQPAISGEWGDGCGTRSNVWWRLVGCGERKYTSSTVQYSTHGKTEIWTAFGKINKLNHSLQRQLCSMKSVLTIILQQGRSLQRHFPRYQLFDWNTKEHNRNKTNMATGQDVAVYQLS